MRVPEIETLDDFTCFLLTYLAEADYQISEPEKEIILNHVTADKYERIKRFIDNRSDYQCLELIDYYKSEFLTDEEARKALLEELEVMYQADPKHSVLERNMIMQLRKFI
jgi:uncharacterized tellurite resistance protein B-like protein